VGALFAIPIGEEELYKRLGLLFGYAFLTNNEYDGFSLQPTAIEAYKALTHQIKSNVASIERGGKSHAAGGKKGLLDSYGPDLIRRMLKAGNSVDEVAMNIVIPAAAAMLASHIEQVFFKMSSADLVCQNA
jgi:hypothetical protein